LNRFLPRLRKDVLLKTVVAASISGFCAACLARSGSDGWMPSREVLAGVYLTGGRGNWHPIFSLLPIITSCLPLHGFLSDDMATKAVYIFPRSHKKAGWLWMQYCQLFLYVIIAALIYLSTIVATLTLFGQFAEPMLNSTVFFGELTLLTCMYWFVFLLSINLCALRLPISAALLITIGINVAFAWISPRSTLVFLSPMTHYYFDIHESSAWYQGILLDNEPYVNRFTWIVSFGYMAVILGLLGAIGHALINRTEFTVYKKAHRKE
jgi:hypothetical protein